MSNLWLIFTTGLIAGGLTCAAIQGGLLAVTIAQQKGNDPTKREVVPIISFLVAKLVAYTILGFFLGWLGSFFQFSLAMQAILLTLVAIFMVGTALSFLEVHPIFRYFIIQPPRFLTRLVRQQTKSQSIFGPAILGAFTIFIPCGTTQAMMALSIASRSPVSGALILATFVLGTFPIFFLLGYSIEWLKDVLQQYFAKVAAYSIFALSLWNFNTAAVLTGKSFTFQNIATNIFCTISFCDTSFANTQVASSTVTIRIQSRGYTVDNPVIAAGKAITLHLVNESGQGCTQAFTIPQLGIQRVVPLGQQSTITFTAPKDARELDYVCGMGMFGGKFSIVGAGS